PRVAQDRVAVRISGGGLHQLGCVAPRLERRQLISPATPVIERVPNPALVAALALVVHAGKQVVGAAGVVGDALLRLKAKAAVLIDPGVAVRGAPAAAQSARRETRDRAAGTTDMGAGRPCRRGSRRA